MKNNIHLLMVVAAGIGVLAWAGVFAPLAAGQAPPGFVAGTESGFATFQTQCAQCHGNPNVDRAPTPTALREMTPEKIYAAMATGVMQQQSSALNDGQKKALAEFMAGRPLGSAKSGAAENMGFQCRTNPPMSDPARGPAWNGWSPELTNSRYQAPDIW
jgi:mono/diheme cytochrome c family protein